MPELESFDPDIAAESDAALLRAFASTGDEAAFSVMVQRHASWAQGVAQRILDDRELARDVTQQVFIRLAQKAARVKPDAVGPWLHRATVLECRNARRREGSRQRAMRTLAEQSHVMKPDHSPAESERADALPLLDDAVNALPERDRSLVVQRFMERKSWREIGALAGRSEDAARMAMAAILEKLARMLRRKGVSVPAAALAALFSTARTSSAATELIARNALASAAAGKPPAFSFSAWISAAACIVAGATAGFYVTPVPASAAARRANPLVAATAGGAGTNDSEVRPAFDLSAVLADLRTLRPAGNELELVVRLRASLIGMPESAIQPVLTTLRQCRWGDDSRLVAESFFYRWGELDAGAAWAVFRAPDLLGAVHKTMPAILDGMSKDDPARFVRMINQLPGQTVFLMDAAAVCQRHLGLLSLAEKLPHVAAIRSPQLRQEVMRGLLDLQSASQCESIAPLATALPPALAMGVVPKLAERWMEHDAASAREWIASLPALSPHRFAAVTGAALSLSSTDPVAAGQMLSGMPWLYSLQEDLKTVTQRWIAADPQRATAWLLSETNLPAKQRGELLKRKEAK